MKFSAIILKLCSALYVLIGLLCFVPAFLESLGSILYGFFIVMPMPLFINALDSPSGNWGPNTLMIKQMAMVAIVLGILGFLGAKWLGEDKAKGRIIWIILVLISLITVGYNFFDAYYLHNPYYNIGLLNSDFLFTSLFWAIMYTGLLIGATWKKVVDPRI